MSEENKQLYLDDEFKERIIAHIIRSPEILKYVQATKLNSDVFVSSKIGLRCYKELADLAIKNDMTYESKDSLLLMYRQAKANGGFRDADEETVETFITWAFNYKLDPPFIKQHLVPFATITGKKKLLAVADELTTHEMKFQLDKLIGFEEAAKIGSTIQLENPFGEVHSKQECVGITTGFEVIDAMGGLTPGECGLIVGHSGSGKTACATSMALGAAVDANKKVLYISCEEPSINIINRWYSNIYNISYTVLHKGGQLFTVEGARNALRDTDPNKFQRLVNNLRIVDVRNFTPINTAALKTVLEDFADKGFIPDVVFIDQMDYMKPTASPSKQPSPWEIYQKVAFELDELSQYKIKGEHLFALWVLHQATGDMKWAFTYNDISSFKGIVKPFDVAVGFGREDRSIPYVNIFSLKVRHCAHFDCPYKAEFEHMRFTMAEEYRQERLKRLQGEKRGPGRPPGSRNKRKNTEEEPGENPNNAPAANPTQLPAPAISAAA